MSMCTLCMYYAKRLTKCQYVHGVCTMLKDLRNVNMYAVCMYYFKRLTKCQYVHCVYVIC